MNNYPELTNEGLAIAIRDETKSLQHALNGPDPDYLEMFGKPDQTAMIDEIEALCVELRYRLGSN